MRALCGSFIRFLFAGFFMVFFIGFLPSTVYAVEELTDATEQYISQNIEKASNAFQNQEYNKSLDFIRHVIKSDMKNYQLRMLAAHNHWRLGNYEPAQVHFSTAQATEPDKPDAYIDHALMLLQMHEPDKARKLAAKSLEKLQKANKSIPAKLYMVLARSSLMQGDVYAAISHCTSAKAIIAKNPDTDLSRKDQLEIILLEGRAQLANEDFTKAELTLNWADSLKPNNPYIKNLIGYLYEEWAKSKSIPTEKISLLKKAQANYQLAASSKDLPKKLLELFEKNLNRVNKSLAEKP